MSATVPAALDAAPSAPTDLDRRPPGERYFRHPGDVVRLVVWGLATLALLLFIEVATGTSEGIRTDVGRAATAIPRPARQLVLAIVQVGAVIAPLGVLAVLLARRRWRRAAIVAGAGAAGAIMLLAVDAWLDLPGRVPGPLVDGVLISNRFPSLAYAAGATAAAIVAKPWLSRAWRTTSDRALIALAAAMIIAGSAGAPEVLLALALGAAVGSAVLVAFGAPNRRPSPADIAKGLAAQRLAVQGLTLQRAVSGRAQLYRAEMVGGGTLFVKVYGRDSRDADLLFRSYRRVMLRETRTDWPTGALERDVEHEALLLMLADRGGVRCPHLRGLSVLGDSSMVLAIEDVEGPSLDALEPDAITPALLDELWTHVAHLHAAGLAHGALRAANVLVTTDGPVIIDFGSAHASALPRARAIDRAELLASTAALVGAEAAVASAARVLAPAELAASMAYLQPLALSAATRRSTPKSALAELRTGVAEATGQQPLPLERLIRVKPRTVFMVVALAGAFYVLLPQLANVDESVRALGSANFGWLAGAVVLSGMTYVASAIGLIGGIRGRLPLLPTTQAQLASSFVNRVTPANVGGMALNVRFMQKAGIEPAEAVTAVGLNVAAGGIVHIVLLVVFFAWAGRTGATAFALPSSSKLLVVIVVVLALVGVVLATRWGRRIVVKHVLRALKQSFSSIASLARSPGRLAALFGGSVLVTLSYIAALACAVTAFDGGVTFAQVGAVYLGSSVIAAAAPTPGGLGAMEAALVAGFTGVGMDSAIAVAAVLSYRLATFWLPILPGWLSFHVLERRNFI